MWREANDRIWEKVWRKTQLWCDRSTYESASSEDNISLEAYPILDLLQHPEVYGDRNDPTRNTRKLQHDRFTENTKSSATFKLI